jgi:hypothetical protein
VDHDTHEGGILDRRVNRRTVVRTGVKLGYATPVVLASYKLTAGAALAATCPRRFVFDPDGQFGAGCYSCGVSRDFGCRDIQDREDRRACRRSEAACRRARFYDADTNQCETRRGVSGGASCFPIFTLPATP